MRQLILGVLLAVAGPVAADVTAITECMRANIPQNVRIQSFELIARDRDGDERVLKGRLYGSRDGDRIRVMARLESPRDMSGTAFLVREAEPADETYVYLPSLSRVKRVAGGSADGRLWGTDFSYGDFKQVQNAFGSGSIVLTGAGAIGGRPVHRLEFAPVAGSSAPYDRVRAAVDQRTCVILEAEFVNAGRVRKRLTAPPDKLKQAGRHWYMSEALLADLDAGTHTVLRVSGVGEAPRLAARYFHPTQFHSAQ